MPTLTFENDLIIDIENDIIFEVSQNISTSRIGFKLPGAIDVGGTGGYSIFSDIETEPTLGNEDFFSGSPDAALIRGGNNLEILYFLSNPIELIIRDLVTLTKGTFTLPNFFDSSIIDGLNYTYADEAVLSATSGRVISELTSTMQVPEPRSAIFMSLAFLLLVRRVRYSKPTRSRSL